MIKIPIILSTNENYAPYCATTITSILINSKNETGLDFYILAAELSEESKEKFEKLKEIRSCSITFIEIDAELFREFPLPRYFTPEAYFRLTLSSTFTNLDKVLYIDCDTIVLTDLQELYNTDIEKYFAGLVLNAMGDDFRKDIFEKLQFSKDSLYFNSGVMLANLKKWREEKIEAKLLDWAKNNREKILWVDQDVINAVFNNFIKVLPEKYNIQLTYHDTDEKISKLEEGIKIIHYCGPKKPWQKKEQFLSEYFWEYAKKNPFFDIIRERYVLNYSEMQMSEVDFIKQLINIHQPKKILEIGVAAGSCLAVMLNEIKNKNDSLVYGIDYSEGYYRDKTKKTGWLVSDIYPELTRKLSLFTGGVSACFLDKIGKGIDFCVIDTTHSLPGELLDFLMVLPYLKENSVCVLHDTNLQNLPVLDGTIRVSGDSIDNANIKFFVNSYATGILASVLASEKIFPVDYLKDFALPNIMAFRITPDLKKYIKNIFYALSIPWQYTLPETDKKIIGDSLERHYSKKDSDYFFQIANLMEKKISLTKEKVKVREKEKNKKTANDESLVKKISDFNFQLLQKNNELEFIKSSKFWKLRNFYLKIKAILKFIIFGKPKSKLIMTLLARNEDDIIKQNIDFHLKHGVDFIIATDNASTDKTRSIFKEYEKKGKLFLIDEPAKDISQAAWNNRMMRMAIEKYKADFIFHCDADEFWRPKKGNLKTEILNSKADVMKVNLVNVLLEEKNGEEIFPQDTRYAVIKPIETNNFEEDSKKQNLYFFQYPAKVIFKTIKGPLNVSHGNHGIVSNIENLKNDISKNIDIYHFPLRNKNKFYKKIIEHGAAIEKNNLLTVKQNWHIRRWHEAYKLGHLDEEYNKLTITKEEAERMKKNGMLEDFDFEILLQSKLFS